MVQDRSIRQTFSKAERLCLGKEVECLFAQGQSFIAYPLRIVYRLQTETRYRDSGVESQILVSVAKKYFRRANKRNRVKRLIREAYRLNKSPWIKWLRDEQKTSQIAFMIVSKELPSYGTIEHAVLKAFRKIQTKETFAKQESQELNTEITDSKS